MKLDYSASTVKLNNAGLPTHTVSIWDRLMRFLILGADAGTFYVKKQDHAYQNCENLKACLDQDFRKTIDTIVDVSDNGRAGKNDHAVFALSVAASHSNKKCRSYALRNLSKVCRIGTHLFQFCHFVDAQRGWGTQLRREVGQWYVGRTAQSMAHQVVKYKSRVVIEGQSKTTWSHRDVLRKTHPKFIDPEQNLIARHYLKDAQNLDKYPDVVDNTCDQVYLPNTQKTSTDNAVNDTWFYTMTRDGLLVRNFYLATEQQCTDSPYQPCMPQWGTQYRAQEGKSWNQIVEQYYNPVTITDLSLSPRAVYRFWSAKYGSHFYTTDIDERNYFIDQYDDDTWHFEGEAFKGADSTDPGAIPVYRFWGPKTKSYFYTANPNEKEEVLAKYPNDWTYQGVKFYVYPDSYPDNYRTVYRFWSDRLQHHFYTANEDEKNYILSHYPTDVWHLEGKAYKVPVN
jgi:hypothetical protein